MELTQAEVKSLFDYENGYILWNPEQMTHINKYYPASLIQNKKFTKKRGNTLRRRIVINQKYFAVSRLIFLWHHGWLPDVVDHKNRISLDDRIENLREATIGLNNKNRTSAIDSSSKYLGVSWKASIGKWQSRIRHNTKGIYLGVYKTQEDAAKAYNDAAIKYHGEFANLNVI